MAPGATDSNIQPRLINTLQGPFGKLQRLAWSPDGSKLVASCEDRALYVWDDFQTTDLPANVVLRGHEDVVGALAWGSEKLASATDNEILLWEQTTKPEGRIGNGTDRPLPAASFTIAWNPKGDKLAFVGAAGFRLYDSLSRKLFAHDFPRKLVTWSPDGQAILLIDYDSKIEIRDSVSLVPLRSFGGAGFEPLSVAWSADGKRIALTRADIIEIWNPRTGRLSGTVSAGFGLALGAEFLRGTDLLISPTKHDVLIIESQGTQPPRLTAFGNRGGSQSFGGFALHPSREMIAVVADEDTAVQIWSLVKAPLASSPPVSTGKKSKQATGVSNLPEPEVPPALVSAVLADECVLYAGAGLSAQAGLPVWRGLVRELFEWAEKNEWFDASYATALRETLQAEDTSSVADAVIGFASPTGDATQKARFQQLHEFLSTLLGVAGKSSKTHENLSKIPFRSVLTTNLDELLNETYPDAQRFVHRDAEKVLELFPKPDSRFVLHLYGSLAVPESIVLTNFQYEEHLVTNRWLLKLVENTFVSRTLLFLGMSLDGINDFLGGLRFSSSQGREHYALLGVTGEAWRVKADNLKRRYGITVIPYDQSAGHEAMARFVETLRNQVTEQRQPARAPETAPAPAAPAPLLRRLTLKNIGPFEDLTLDLTSGWNVLLGDNGVGKSSITRAIAVALVGREASDFAGRLIKKGSSHAKIELETSVRTYVTELFGTDGPVEISSTASPLESEGWLALGFPALRALTWKQRSSYEVGAKRRPTAGDLIPLIRGEPDPRPDEFKAWLIENDADRSYLDPLTRFFEKLTPGLGLKFDQVDRQKRQILVESGGVQLPLEMVSQGTASLLGWFGVFLQRQNEIHQLPLDEASQKPAFVLIDEIDAHMHPKWQRLIVPAMTSLFPNLQVLATTHSSLIVSSLKEAQLTVLRRRENRVQILRPQIQLQGFRADQILTSELFELEDTVDPETRQLLDEYVDLLEVGELKGAQKERLAEVAELLRLRVPSPAQRKEAREAADLIRDYMKSRMDERTTEETERVMREVHLQLTNALTGNQTPS
jgi:predicted ATP-binding protein involved in virulence